MEAGMEAGLPVTVLRRLRCALTQRAPTWRLITPRSSIYKGWLLEVSSFPTTDDGYGQLLDWMRGFGTLIPALTHVDA
jgi:hypothetical protein